VGRALQELDADRVTIALLSGATIGYVCPTDDGFYFLLNEAVPEADRRAAIAHLAGHAGDVAEHDDVAAWCEAPACVWARLAFGSTAARCASGTA
jgi:DNA-binding helix-hairpin-helix protein with protein kinase domain